MASAGSRSRAAAPSLAARGLAGFLAAHELPRRVRQVLVDPARHGILLAERDGTPFFIYRYRTGEQRIVGLSAQRTEFTVGRNASADVTLDWDDQVSAVHAVIERLAGELMLLDDGLSRNGSYVNDERVHGRRRLRDGDLLRFGRTNVLIRNPADPGRSTTAPAPMPICCLVNGPPCSVHLTSSRIRAKFFCARVIERMATIAQGIAIGWRSRRSKHPRA